MKMINKEVSKKNEKLM